MFKRIFAICLSVSAAATAQISRLVTNGDGSVLYFASPQILLGDTSEAKWSKIFRYRQDTGNIELAHQIASFSEVNGYGGTTPYILEFPDVSSDGATLVYTGRGGNCYVAGSACAVYIGAFGYLAGASPPRIVADGSVRLSRNGRYVLAFRYFSGYVSDGLYTTVQDLQTGNTVQLGLMILPVGDGYQIISDAGGVLLGNNIFNAGYVPLLGLSQIPIVERMSADAKRIVYEAYAKDHNVLILYDVDSNRETVLAQDPPMAQNGAIFSPWISDDGSLVLYLDSPAPGLPRQAFVLPTDGSAIPKQLTSEQDGISTAVLSGMGNVAYAATATNRIIQIQVASGTVQQIAGPASIATGWGVPGSFAHLTASGLPAGLQSGSVQIGGLDAPVLNATPTSLDVQIPWGVALPDLNGSAVPITIKNQFGSPFNPSVINVYYVSPYFLRQPQTDLSMASLGVTAHQDFHGLVTQDDPAQPGEILHFYMTGLGPVSPAIATGQVTPTGPLYTVSGPPTCSFYSGDHITETQISAPLLFAGLAPGMIGIYQVDVQVPSGLGLDPAFGCIGYLPKTSIFDSVPIPLSK